MATEAQKMYAKEWYAKNKERESVKRRSYYEANKEVIKLRAKTWESQNPIRVKERGWKRKGIEITHAEYEAMLVQQEYRCAICGVHASELDRALCVDHDHKTGQVRGLLCNNCNRSIGLLQDDPDVLRAALIYLSGFQVVDPEEETGAEEL